MSRPSGITACTYVHTSACVHSPETFLSVTRSTNTSKIRDAASPPPQRTPGAVASACSIHRWSCPHLRPSGCRRRRNIMKPGKFVSRCPDALHHLDCISHALTSRGKASACGWAAPTAAGAAGSPCLAAEPRGFALRRGEASSPGAHPAMAFGVLPWVWRGLGFQRSSPVHVLAADTQTSAVISLCSLQGRVLGVSRLRVRTPAPHRYFVRLLLDACLVRDGQEYSRARATPSRGLHARSQD